MPKMAIFAKELSSFQITTTIILCLSMSFFVVILGMFINDKYKKIIVYEDIYFPLPPNNSCTSANNSPSSHNAAGYSNGVEFKDWLSPKDVWHSMSDQELLWRASMAPHIAEYPFNRTAKVAFMFLARGRLPLAPLWEMFFRGHEGLFNIYLHISPQFSYNEPPESSVFYKRRIPSKVFYSNLYYCCRVFTCSK